MPFIADEIYGNLVCSIDPLEPESVHLTDWPKFDENLIDAKLMEEMALVMKLVSLGHAARNKANIKVRQPLSEVAFVISSTDNPNTIEYYAELLKEELNVKKVRTLDAAGEVVAYELVPLPKQLGQKYKNLYPQLRNAILKLPTEKTALDLLDGKNIPVQLEDVSYEILPDEIEVRIQAKQGFEVTSEGVYVAALVTEISEPLEFEGLAREFIRRVQDARKQAGMDISDRIKLTYTCSEKLGKAISAFSEYIKAETLTVELNSEAIPNVLPNSSEDFDGEQMAIWISK
jgi:isoleucyl-tRNA synthetase